MGTSAEQNAPWPKKGSWEGVRLFVRICPNRGYYSGFMVDYCGKTIGILFLNVWSVKPSKNQQGSKNVYNYGRLVAYEPNSLYKSMTYTTLFNNGHRYCWMF